MAFKTNKPTIPPDGIASTDQSRSPGSQSLQATVVSVFTKIIDKDTSITYALLKSEKDTLIAAWRNSYFARDIMVHRKYTFSGKLKRNSGKLYLANPTFIDVPGMNRYFEFALAAPSGSRQPKSPATKVVAGVLILAVIAVLLTLAFNSNTFEQAMAGRNQEVSVNTQNSN